ncbi:hypothetical protein BGX38DRAFT_815614 [Terfezia claveryi]|nr:hypothetical protein BGX38DRAFT_815614 [Terfezia claveryi]
MVLELMTIQQLAEGMVNSGSDPEKLVIQYAVSTPVKPVTTYNVWKDTLESILIPRKRILGDTLFTLTFRGKDNATSEYVTGLETWLWQPYNVSSEHMALYKRLHIPGVEDELITNLGKLVEITHDHNNKDYNTNKLIQSFFKALSQHAKHIRYEAWNSEQDLESYSLAEGLEKFSKSFPPKFPSDKDNEAKVKVYHVTLTRLLVLVHAHKSDPSIDLRIWQLAGQLLAIASAPNPRNEFAIKIGSFVVKGVLDFCMGRTGGDGGGNPGLLNGRGAAQGRPGNRWGWGRTLGCAAGLVTLQVSSREALLQDGRPSLGMLVPEAFLQCCRVSGRLEQHQPLVRRF